MKKNNYSRSYPYPLGANLCRVAGEDGANFAIFSAVATKVEVCIFSDDKTEIRHQLQYDRARCVWHGFVAGVTHGCAYGFRVTGAYDPSRGNFCNHQKLLLDPHAKAISGVVNCATADQLAWYRHDDCRDNAHLAPRALVVNDDFDWQGDCPPTIAWQETVIYELHVGGFSRQMQQIAPEKRATFAALHSANAIAHFKNLGVTTLELLPITFHLDECHLQNRQLVNYWGYNVIGHCAVDGRFASDASSLSALRELKTAVRELHRAGLEVILDVVFNHSAEQESNLLTLCQRGIDNRSYYLHDSNHNYCNFSGCGNTFDFASDAVINWTLTILRYWVTEVHIDGFRFDLATVLGRNTHFNRRAAFFSALLQDEKLQAVKLIAEPWDIGNDGYQLGNFPMRFAQWNDRFRDDMRQFWLQENGEIATFARRFCGSNDIFDENSAPSYISLNFITAHDGFTLYDLLSYHNKNNYLNGENNRDGSCCNFSNNHGVEGDSAPLDILQSRRNSALALLASLLLARGTPMLLAGDEIANSQNANNNAYCQDNEITWLQWHNKRYDLRAAIAKLLQIRREINALNGRDEHWQQQVLWLNVDGEKMENSHWQNAHQHALQMQWQQNYRFLINGKKQAQSFKLDARNWTVRFGDVNLQDGAANVNTLGFFVIQCF